MRLYLPYGETVRFQGLLPLRYWRNAASEFNTADSPSPQQGLWDYLVEITDMPRAELEKLDRFINRFVIPAMFNALSKRSPTWRRRLTRWFGNQGVRRAFPRQGVHLPVALEKDAAAEADLWYVTDDLSEGGLALTLPTPGLEGSETGFTLILPQGQIEGAAQIVREEPVRLFGKEYYRYGLRFADLSPEDRERIRYATRYAIETEAR